ncbi:hypothetical protein O6H91_03G021500 [Diphasiastrum complanatum]|uniref:Uncharacterized protein n=1 Tax=Diphasiastrum complanatum TaxID=34168 RepID=A0ACC2E498_DIPCM|nr:hypothetical protein O6H91_03G021500 [Diphasiastrum complanatum]
MIGMSSLRAQCGSSSKGMFYYYYPGHATSSWRPLRSSPTTRLARVFSTSSFWNGCNCVIISLLTLPHTVSLLYDTYDSPFLSVILMLIDIPSGLEGCKCLKISFFNADAVGIRIPMLHPK